MLEALVTGGEAVLGTGVESCVSVCVSCVFRVVSATAIVLFDCPLIGFIHLLTYGVAGCGERRDGSIRGWVELLLDFGADNPDKVNNRHGSINASFHGAEISHQTGPASDA